MDFSYPFTENKETSYTTITESMLSDQFKVFGNLFYSMSIGLYNNYVLMVPGCSKDLWDDHVKLIYLTACTMCIPYVYFIWDIQSQFHLMTISSFNYLELFPVPENFPQMLLSNYGLGYTIPFINSVRESLLTFCGNGPFQIFVSPPNSNGSNHISKRIQPFGSDNIPAFDVINERRLSVFCHARLNMNLCKFDESNYITNLLNYCTGHGIKGAVFHVGTNKDIPINDALKHMMTIIVTGISNFRARGIGTCKFLLETPAAEGNETLFTDESFISFCMHIKNIPGVGEHFGICIDTCHVFAAGYSPYNYIKNISKYMPIDLVHFNDSKNRLGSKLDRHEIAGRGYIPWYILLKSAEFCQKNNIPMINEW